MKVLSFWNLRGKYSKSRPNSVRTNFNSVQLLGNYHPFAGRSFRITAGALYNGNNVNLSVVNNRDITINGYQFGANDLSSVRVLSLYPVLNLGCYYRW